MRIIDAHCHIYPEKIAAKAVENVGSFYHVEMSGKGTVSDLLALQQSAGISASIVHSVALKPANVQSINDFVAEQAGLHPSLIGFATMHQDFEDMEAEVERCIALGLRGFKLHPDSQGVNADDPRLMRLYGIIEGRLPIILHCGDYRWDNSHPHRIREILHAFPKLVMNAAHFGGWGLYDLAVEYLENESCFMDLSSASVYLGPRRTTELIRIHGPERILFGSDYPMWSPVKEVERFMLNDLSDSEREMVCWQNAERFLGKDCSAARAASSAFFQEEANH
ncbi:MAG: amidohydrolase family protein [Coriobacteriia bacterium]|nr:amidohydrolase family protein [Coriobacteriia bacterium]